MHALHCPPDSPSYRLPCLPPTFFPHLNVCTFNHTVNEYAPTFSYFDLGRENENRETLQAEFEFSHLLYDIKVSLIVGELHPSHAKLFVQGHFVCGVYFSE